jgi:hypothetical protein
MLEAAKPLLQSYLAELPPETRLRLDGIEAELVEVQREMRLRLWQIWLAELSQQAEQEAGRCKGCGRRCDRKLDNVEVLVKGETIPVPVVYYYCRRCHRGQAPLRQWLGIHHGSESSGFARVLVSLCLMRSFGDGAREMKEQHGQEVDRTRAERVTYQVAQQAQVYLQQRREEARAGMAKSEQATVGVDLLTLTADGGAVPVGTLVRPGREQATEFTSKRKLPKGRREQTKREVRLIAVHPPEVRTERTVDIHVAPHDHPEVSGERMYAAAVLAGLGDNTRLHGVFDMGTWIRTQFDEQFFKQRRSICCDIYHVDEYLGDAAHALLPRDEGQRKDWLATVHQWLKHSDGDLVIQQLLAHVCRPGCPKDDRGDCNVQVALRYLCRFSDYMDYARFIAEGLPIGSGEAEGAIRHWVRRRLDVPGAWTEDHLKDMCALLTLKASGWWEDFWRWRDKKDVDNFHLRREGKLKATVFRGTPRTPAQAATLPN